MTEDVRREMNVVIRWFEKFSPEMRANMASSHRLGPRQKRAVGQYFYTHPAVPGVAFETRSRAASAGAAAKSDSRSEK